MLKAHPWGSLLAGFLILLLAPLVLLLIAITCLGLPLSLVLGSLYLSALFIAPLFIAMLVGRWLQRKPGGNPYLALLLGLLLIMVVLWIPVVNLLALLLILVLGLGSLALALQARTAHPLFAAAAHPTPAEHRRSKNRTNGKTRKIDHCGQHCLPQRGKCEPTVPSHRHASILHFRRASPKISYSLGFSMVDSGWPMAEYR